MAATSKMLINFFFTFIPPKCLVSVLLGRIFDTMLLVPPYVSF
jgi:hypothetical protein